MNPNYLDFEQPVAELQAKIEELRLVSSDSQVNLSDEISRLEEKSRKLTESIFKDLKLLFEKKGYIINWKSLEKQDLSETINALAMASPFSLEEKQILLESKNLEARKDKISEILSTYSFDDFHNTTIQ